MAIRAYTTGMGGLTTLVPRLLTIRTSGTVSTPIPMNDILGATISSSGTPGDTTVSVATVKNHGLKTGDYIVVTGSSFPEFNGKFVITVVDKTHLTYAMLIANNAAHADTGATISFAVQFQQCLIIADSGNSANLQFGPNANADADAVPAGTTYRLDSATGAKMDLSDWYIQSTAASQTARLLII